MKKNRKLLFSIGILFFVLVVCSLIGIFFNYFRNKTGALPVPPNAQTIFSQGRPLFVINGITKEMLTYNHWSGSYAPTVFRLSIEGTSILAGQSGSFQLNKENILVVRYDYSFVHGYRSGARVVYFQIPSEVNSVVIQFSWQQKSHLILDRGQVLRTEVVPFDTTIEESI
jgi:ABC-type transport system involved in multi-copper enzyme maturation permease subunit